MNNQIGFLGAWCACLLLVFSTQAAGKSFYVELWGDNDNSCSRTEPCQTLQSTVDKAGRNDRVIVGPGNHSVATLTIDNIGGDRDGLRLESTHGRNATVIHNFNSQDAIRVIQPKVRIGKSRGGFTIRGGEAADKAGILVYSNGNGVKIEGNRLDRNYNGIRIIGAEKVQVRNNIVENDDNSSGGGGIYCVATLGGCPSALISNNALFNLGGAGINVGRGDKVVVTGNSVRNYAATGIYFGPQAAAARVKDNAVTTGGYGIRLVNADGATVQGNISMNITPYEGFNLAQSTTERSSPKFVSNLSVESNSGDGARLDSLTNAKVDRNTVSYSGDSGFRIVGSSLGSMRNNNSVGNDTGGPSSACDVRSDSVVTFTRQFFGLPEPTLPDTDYACGASPATGSTAGKLNRTATNKASAL
jgi:parallel beta-helix repeat protein